MPDLLKVTKTMGPGKNNYFFTSEILPDFQARLKSRGKSETETNMEINHVGMETINARSHPGKYFVEFASSSTIHGLNHLVAPHRHPIEKLLAVLFIVGALIFLFWLSFIFWNRFQDNATVIVLNNNRQQFKLPKPSFYVCPLRNVDDHKFITTFKRHDIEHTTEARDFFVFLASLNYDNIADTPDFDKVSPDKWTPVLFDLRKDIDHKVLAIPVNYSQIWTMTERGVCLAARSVFADYVSINNWMKNNSEISPELNNIQYYDFNTDLGGMESVSVNFGMSLAVSDPLEILHYETPMRKTYSKSVMSLAMLMTQIETFETVKELSIRQRKCKFLSDGGLKTWPVYTRSMCVIECRMNIIYENCHCRPHFVKPIGIPICNASQLRCIGSIRNKLFLNKDPPHSCSCLENCNRIQYSLQKLTESDLTLAPINSTVCNLNNQFPVVTYHRALLFGFVNFLTAVGGAAGLFLGASVLSFVEIFFYATLRMFIYIKNVRWKSRGKMSAVK